MHNAQRWAGVCIAEVRQRKNLSLGFPVRSATEALQTVVLGRHASLERIVYILGGALKRKT
jgi:hypothetical protein